MKSVFKKITVILFLMLMLINNSLLMIISVAVDEIESLIEKSKVNLTYSMDLEKYANYSLDDNNKGVLLQLDLKSLIEYEDKGVENIISATGILLNLPKIYDEYPENVEVLSENLENVKVEYDKENGNLKILEAEKDECEYTMYIYYGQNCYTLDKTERTFEITGKVIVQLANEENDIISIDVNETYNVDNNISDIISTTLDTTEIYNGYINSNRENGTNYVTEYTENLKVEIGYKEIANEVKLKLSNKFISGDELVDTNEIIFKSTKINKNEVLAKLGEEGYLKILNSKGEVLGEINKETESQEDGYVEFIYENEITELEIVMSAPVELGILNIENNRYIKDTVTNIEDNKIIEVHLIQGINNIEILDDETQESTEYIQEEIYSFENGYATEIKDAETRIDLSVDKTEWTNNVQNEVTFIATLVTSGSQYSLFKNPVIEIKMPEEVEKVILNDINLLYDNNLSIKEASVVEKDGCKVIRIEVTGTQNEYVSNDIINGVDIIVPITVILSQNIDSTNSNIEMTYQNELETKNDYENNGQEFKKIDIEINAINNNIKESRNTSEITDINEIKQNLEVKIETQVGNEILKNGDVIYEKQIIKYVVTLTNNGDNKISDIDVSAQIPEGTVYATIDSGTYFYENYEYIEDESIKNWNVNIESLEVGETQQIFYEVVVSELEEESKNISNTVEVKVQNEVIISQTSENIIKPGILSTFIKSYIGRDEKNYIHYWLEIENISDDVVKNVNIETSVFSKEMEFIDAILYEGDTPEIGEFSDNKYLANIGDIQPGEKKVIVLRVAAGNFDDNINVYELKMSMVTKADDIDEIQSNENRRDCYPEYVTVTQESDKTGTNVKVGEQITYTVKIKNESKIRTSINIYDYLSEYLYGEEAKFQMYDFGDDIYTEYDLEEEATKEYPRKEVTIDIGYVVTDNDGNNLPNIEFYTTIPAGRELEIVFTARAKEVEEPTVVSNYITVSGKYINTKVSNIITFTIVPEGYEETVEPEDPDKPDNPDNPDNPNNPDKPNDPENPTNPDDSEDTTKKYSISGVVWLDKDENGLKNNENNMNGITVKIYNVDDNTILKDENGNSRILTTNEDGSYKFDNISNGKYLILFEFNTDEYDVTKYNVSSERYMNSVVLLKEASIDGVIKKVAVTDIINVDSDDVTNINMGLIYKANFDLKLDKYVSKIKVVNANGTSEYEYEDKKLAKVEIPAKQIDNTTIEIEYKIKITNEGTVDGWVTEIIDYLPNGLILNDDNWKINSDGNAYTNILSGTKISGGDSKEVTLTVTKQLSTETMGTFVNSAEIVNCLNIKNLKDRDSNPGNKNKEEDDYSEATVIISVKTGIIRNIFIGIIIIGIAILVIYFLLKNNKKIGNLNKIALFIMILLLIGTNSAYALNIKGPSPGGPYYGDDGNLYHCMDPGWGQCSTGDHYYSYAGTADDSGWNEDVSQRVTQTIDLTQNSDSVQFTVNGNNYLVGPYYLYTNQSVEISIAGTYVTNYNGVVSENSISSSQIILTSNGGGNYTLYFVLPLHTIEVKNITASQTIINGESRTYVRTWTNYYYCSSVSNHTDGNASLQHANNASLVQRMKLSIPQSDSYTDYYNVTKTISLAGKTYKGSIKITKKDYDTGSVLQGATFSITGGNANITVTGTTNESGLLQFDNLQPGSYTITEIGVPSGYNLELQTDIVKVTNVNANVTTNVDFTNRLYGNLIIKKVDEDTGNTLGKDVKFKVYVLNNGVKNYIKTYTYGKPSTLTYTTNADEAMILTTKADGTTPVLENIPMTNIIYYIEESELPINLQHYYEVKQTVDAVVLQSNVYGQTVATITNKQLYVDVSGYVWEDIGTTKMTTRNDLYKDNSFDTDDKLVEEITVRLRKSDGTLIAETKTDKNGTYKFYGKDVEQNKVQIEISKLPNYYIEFEYNGLLYESVIAHIDKDNGSKAVEDGDDRKNFNNSFAIISGGNSKEDSTLGYSRNTDNQITNNLLYNNGNYSSLIFSDMGYTADSANGNITPNDGSVGVVMKADTDTAKYKILWSPGVYEIKNINLGIYKREQPDMAIASDLDTVDLMINGYSHTYSYGERYKLNDLDIFSEITKYDSTSTSYNNTSYIREYSRGIYSNYAYANSTTGEGKLDNNNKLQFYATYKITVKNESSSLKMTANEIVNYCDMTFDLESLNSWYVDSNGNKIDVVWNYIKDTNGYYELRTTSLKNVKIENGQSIVIYMNIQKKADQVVKWGEISDLENFEEKTYNVAEITSYSTYDSDGSIYAGIDKDSAPDNIIPGIGQEYVKRYEDDTDSAPVLTIKLNKPRTISGYVFEEYTDSEINTNEERKGDGKYNASEDGYVGNVKVELINAKTEGDIAYIYPEAVSDNNFDAKKAEYVTTKEEKGYYEFVGVIPGKYYLKFTYDDGSVIYKTVNGETVSVEVNTQNYKSTIITSSDVKAAVENDDKDENQRWYQKSQSYSSAVDDYEKRLGLNGELSTINYENIKAYEDEDGEYANYHVMIAKSPVMDIAIENKNGETTIGEENRIQLYDNIDFGIVERPRQKLELYKDISYIKLKLANGQILAEGDPRNETINYVTYPEGGLLKIEVDSEIIEGATLEITFEMKVKNNSEVDYNTRDYYVYGIKGTTPVATNIDTIIDYMDENLKTVYTYSSDDNSEGVWHIVSKKTDSSLDGIKMDSDAYSTIKNNHNVLIINNPKLKIKQENGSEKQSSSLLPGEEGTINVDASKLLSTSEEMVYENKAELFTVSNVVGRFYGQEDTSVEITQWKLITPGNYDISEESDELDEADRGDVKSINNGNNGADNDDGTLTGGGRLAKLVIIPPTGIEDIITYVLVGLGCLVILSGGIILIKKKVLD